MTPLDTVGAFDSNQILTAPCIAGGLSGGSAVGDAGSTSSLILLFPASGATGAMAGSKWGAKPMNNIVEKRGYQESRWQRVTSLTGLKLIIRGIALKPGPFTPMWVWCGRNGDDEVRTA